MNYLIHSAKSSIYFSLLTAIILFVRCSSDSDSSYDNGETTVGNISESTLSTLQWLNRPDSFMLDDKILTVRIKGGTDFFNNPEDSSITTNAPFLHQEYVGDFYARVKVEPDFSSLWNAVSLMVYLDSLNWIKFAFENSDATGPGIVSVVTKGTSDDANGVVLTDQKSIWLLIAKKNNNYAMHWSLDGKTFTMARLTSSARQKPSISFRD
jgi:hypothetical protein